MDAPGCIGKAMKSVGKKHPAFVSTASPRCHQAAMYGGSTCGFAECNPRAAAKN